MSTEAEKYLRNSIIENGTLPTPELMESYHQAQLSKKLEALTDDKIMEIIDNQTMSWRELLTRSHGAKAIIDHLKKEL